MLYEIEQFTVRHCYISKKVFQIKYQLQTQINRQIATRNRLR